MAAGAIWIFNDTFHWPWFPLFDADGRTDGHLVLVRQHLSSTIPALKCFRTQENFKFERKENSVELIEPY